MLDLNYDGLDISVDNYVAVVEIQRGPNNFFDTQMISDLADAFDKMEASDDVRAVVLCSEGKHFCAGNNFGSASGNEERAYEIHRDRAGGTSIFASQGSEANSLAGEEKWSFRLLQQQHQRIGVGVLGAVLLASWD